jgi:hypothetical protein
MDPDREICYEPFRIRILLPVAILFRNGQDLKNFLSDLVAGMHGNTCMEGGRLKMEFAGSQFGDA